MASFEANKEHIRHVLIFLFNQKKKAAESHRIIVETYGVVAPTVKTCERWFQRFKKGDFNINDKERENRPKKFEDNDLQRLLQTNDTQTQKRIAEKLNVTQKAISLRLRTMGKIQTVGKMDANKFIKREIKDRKKNGESRW